MTRKNNRCYRGHELTPENSYRMSNGFTSCRKCARLLWRNYYYRKKAKERSR